MRMTRTVDTNKSAKKHPAKYYIGIVLKAILLTCWVGFVTIASQFIIALPMRWVLGPLASTPVATAIYSALSYMLSFVIILFATPWLRALFFENKPRKKSKSARATTATSAITQKSDHNPRLITRTELGLRGLPTWTDLGLGVVGYIATMIIAVIVCSFLDLFPWFNLEQSQDVGFGDYLVGADRIIAFLALVIVAPIAEELIFRGWLYGKLRGFLDQKLSKRLGIALSIFLVSLLFGMLHGQWNVGVIVFVMSTVMCIMREFTGTIYAGIITHMLKNGIAFFMLYVFNNGGFNF